MTVKLQIKRTHDDAGVISLRGMQTNKVPAIECHDGPIVGRGQQQNRLVSERLAGFADVAHRHDIVADPTQRFHDRKGNVFVGEQARHWRLRALVFADLLIDLVAVRAHVCPGTGQIFRPERWIQPEQLGLGRPEPPCLLQYPDWDARADDDRLAAAHAIDRIDARIRIAQLLRYPYGAPDSSEIGTEFP